ncbi:hypothetical protein [Microvirga antarctica]|uniref:hypothetical protein n=1 Tax=Microvirga antarctica TaxID=2819233 RepID=UPI001B306C4A|nr:hypothetical protein [Microvirga antarctica]
MIERPWYQALSPHLQLTSRHPRNTDLMTTLRGYRFAAGMGGSILSRGADHCGGRSNQCLRYAIRNESRRVNEAFDNTLVTRLNDKHGAIVITMRRLHHDDLVGHMLARVRTHWL